MDTCESECANSSVISSGDGIQFLNWPVPCPSHLSPDAPFLSLPPSPCCAINLQKVLTMSAHLFAKSIQMPVVQQETDSPLVSFFVLAYKFLWQIQHKASDFDL